MKIFITGASGFVGGAFVKTYAKTHDITAMSRSDKSDAAIRALGATPVRAALGEVKTEQLKGFDAVVHCAAYVEEWGPWEDYWRVNVDGTKELLIAAKGADVKRFVHIGTEAALFHGQHMRNVDEHYPLSLNSPYPYARTKAHAEKAVREANDSSTGFTTIVVRPRFVWGPGDQTILPAIKAMVEKGQFAWIDGGRNKTSTTYIGNLTHAMNLALTKGQGGNAYFVLDGPPVVFREFMTRMLNAAGVIPGDRAVPGWIVRTIAYLGETAYRALNIKSKPPLTRFTANIMSRDCILIDDKAKREMGYAPAFTIDQGLEALRQSL
ncbi:MAG: NAD-dependent epimerase/dehydratase family protein [Alphaproteobacteria bacterium]|jgi:nucleoside-diphosphate-sugar epimerase|nr:NAD-dependent epimerase/dehydratase family protein [Alphaproteobacteria bacterium]